MGKIIAVCGSPGSGKTIFSLKLSKSIYDAQKGVSVIFVSPDMSVPTLGYLFPNSKDESMYSLGAALDKTDIYQEDVIKQFVTTKTMRDFAALGFKLSENRYSYPEPTEDKVCQLFSALRKTADYIVVDCTSDENELIGYIAKRDCDIAIQVANPNIKSAVYFSSCINQFLMIENKKISVLNIIDNDVYLPIDETKNNLSVDFSVPYSRALKQQMITGTLIENIHDNKYLKAVNSIAKAVMNYDKNG